MKLRILGCGTSSGVPRIGNDWGACRDGCRRAHKGVDVIGTRLQPILAIRVFDRLRILAAWAVGERAGADATGSAIDSRT